MTYSQLVEKSRVVLQTIDGVEGSDYINASFVKVFIMFVIMFVFLFGPAM
jgi:protein tyrosine phosphatase